MRVGAQNTDCILDIPGTLTRLAGDEQLHRELLQFYLEDAPPLCQEIERAAAAGDAAELRASAHALKGLIAGCGGLRAAHVAQRLEHAAYSGDTDSAATLIDELKVELERLTQVVQQHLR